MLGDQPAVGIKLEFVEGFVDDMEEYPT